MYQTAAIASAVLILYVASLVAHVNLVNGVMLTVSVRKIAAYQTAVVVFVVLILFAGCLVVTVVVPILATLRGNASVLRTAAVAFAVLILYVASLAHVNLVNGVMLTVSVRKIAAYQTAVVVFVVLILFAGSLVAAAVAPKLATPRVNASVLRTAASRLRSDPVCGQSCGSCSSPKTCNSEGQCSVLRTAAVVFVVLILYVVSLVVVVVVPKLAIRGPM